MVPKTYLTPIVFSRIQKQALRWAAFIETHKEELIDILLEYESYEVACDEIERTIDHLTSLKENEKFFKLRIGEVAAFLPRNQPLYALTCFVVVPSLMASEVHFRIPSSMKTFLPKVLSLLEVLKFFPNLKISTKERSEFLTERTSLRIDPKTSESLPRTDVVIFTGTSVHADQLRFVFDQRTLFITNGAGHNPLVVSNDADLTQAVDAVLTLQLYNQGQDCAAPNAILVHTSVREEFVKTLKEELAKVRVGQYRDRVCRVGPISDPEDLVRIEEFLIEHQQWIDSDTPGIIRSRDAILEPTIIQKPLTTGGNYVELFSPIIVVQEYESDLSLAHYFENQQYAKNAMYVTVYGSSAYVKSLAGKEFHGKLLHDRTTILFNTHLHAHGVERGTKPYGGYGYGASNISIAGVVKSQPTLPQREIFKYIAEPLLKKGLVQKRKLFSRKLKAVREKDVQKLLKLKSSVQDRQVEAHQAANYVDTIALEKNKRYVQLKESNSFSLLDTPNLDHIALLTSADISFVRAVRTMLMKPVKMSNEQFTIWLYTLAGNGQKSPVKRKEQQSAYFKHLYQLLLGKNAGPRFVPFLLEIDRQKVVELLDV